MTPTTITEPATGRAGLGWPYRRLWTAAVVSRVGDSLRTPALALLSASLTRDPRAIAAVVAAGQLPPLLFGLLGGVYADRWERRRTMAAVDGARALLVAAFAVLVGSGRASVPALVVCAFGLAALGTLFDASAFAVLPSIVPADQLATANGRLQAGTSVVGGFLGAPVAGVLFGLAAALPFAADATSFALAAGLALTLPAAAHPSVRRSFGDGPGRSHETGQQRGPKRTINAWGGRAQRIGVWREAGDGLRWMRGDRTLLVITVLSALTNLAISALIAVIVLYALEVLGVGQSWYGLFMSAALAGALLGGLGAGRLAGRLGTLAALRWILLAETLALTGLALSRHPLPGAVALAIFSAGTAAWNGLTAAYGQRHVPPDLLGRVGSAQRMAGTVTAPVGALLGGAAADAWGTPAVGAAAAALFALVTAGSWRLLGSARETGAAGRTTSGGTADRPDRHRPR